jgi:ferrous iron transport protein B
VEKKEGIRRFQGITYKFIDLPGTYSLTAYTLEEIVVRDFLINDPPDVVVQVVDGSNLERNLYLTVQLIELGVPLVLALNMYDELIAKGWDVDVELLGQLLGCRVVPTIGSKGHGTGQLLKAVRVTAETARKGSEAASRKIKVNYGREFEDVLETIEAKIAETSELGDKARWLAVRILEGDNDAIARLNPELLSNPEFHQLIEDAAERLNKLYPEGIEEVIADRRYGFIAGALQETLIRSGPGRREISEKIDCILTHQILGMPLFLLFLWILFQGTFSLGEIPMRWIEGGMAFLGGWLSSILPAGPVADLLVDGVIGGVGGVLVFLPNIMILFLGISIFEDSGYMARAAFLMDRLMHSLGLHGKSFIPLIMGFGCSVPAIMATRTLESRRDRLLTILITPLMSCSARLPVYILIAGTFFPQHAGNIIFGLYLFGVVTAIAVGKLLSMTLFRAKGAPFVMELPPYRMPTVRTSIRHMWDRSSQYLKKMGTVILAASVIVWFLGAFPRSNGQPPAPEKSYIGDLGHALAPVLDPLGYDWQIGVALLTGMVAKEVVISTLGVIYGSGDQVEEEGSEALSQALKNSGLTPLGALALMLFVLLYTPCLASMVAIWRETGRFGWMIFSMSYQTGLAWTVAFITIKMGTLLGF